MESNQTPQNTSPQESKPAQPVTQNPAKTGNRTMMIVVGVIAGLAVLGLVWVCLVFFKMV